MKNVKRRRKSLFLPESTLISTWWSQRAAYTLALLRQTLPAANFPIPLALSLTSSDYAFLSPQPLSSASLITNECLFIRPTLLALALSLWRVCMRLCLFLLISSFCSSVVYHFFLPLNVLSVVHTSGLYNSSALFVVALNPICTYIHVREQSWRNKKKGKKRKQPIHGQNTLQWDAPDTRDTVEVRMAYWLYTDRSNEKMMLRDNTFLSSFPCYPNSYLVRKTHLFRWSSNKWISTKEFLRYGGNSIDLCEVSKTNQTENDVNLFKKKQKE